MVKVIVQHHVADYDVWYPVFVEHQGIRKQHGATGHSINREATKIAARSSSTGQSEPPPLLWVFSTAMTDARGMWKPSDTRAAARTCAEPIRPL